MNSNELRHNGAQSRTDAYDLDRALAAARLARCEFAVDLLFSAANALATLVASLAARLSHGTTSGKSWFAH